MVFSHFENRLDLMRQSNYTRAICTTAVCLYSSLARAELNESNSGRSKVAYLCLFSVDNELMRKRSVRLGELVSKLKRQFSAFANGNVYTLDLPLQVALGFFGRCSGSSSFSRRRRRIRASPARSWRRSKRRSGRARRRRSPRTFPGPTSCSLPASGPSSSRTAPPSSAISRSSISCRPT